MPNVSEADMLRDYLFNRGLMDRVHHMRSRWTEGHPYAVLIDGCTLRSVHPRTPAFPGIAQRSRTVGYYTREAKAEDIATDVLLAMQEMS